MHLVRQLADDRSNDTLGRWLSHHVAELMNAVEQAKSPDEKAQKLKEAADLILRIWERRSALPGEAHPLGRFREAISVLLKYEGPYSYLSSTQIPTSQSLAHKISIASGRLELFVKLLSGSTGENAHDPIDEAALEALSDEELDAIERLALLLEGGSPSKAVKPSAQDVPVEEKIDGIVAQMINDLQQLQRILKDAAEGKPADPATEEQ